MNNHDVFSYQFFIEDFSLLLAWLMLLCFLGFCAVGWMMKVTSRFFMTKSGEKFSIMQFELPLSYSKFKTIIDNSSEKTKQTVCFNLKLDYYFMPFAYFLMFFTGWFVLQRQHYTMQQCGYYKMLWLPFAAWLFDILENKMAFICLENLTKTNARLLFVFSTIKWLLIAVYIIFVGWLMAGFIS